MFTSASPLQDRRGASKALGLSVQPSTLLDAAAAGSALPPLKSPRGHLLDRIRSTPRSSKFVPQGATTTTSNPGANKASESWAHKTPVSNATTHQRGSSISTPPRSANIYTPQRHAHSNSMNLSGMQNHDLAKSDQLAILEQQLRSQNNLLAQQQMLLQKLQYQQQSVSCPTPPYTPEARASPAANSVIYDPATGQYYMYAPQYTPQPQFQFNVTPAQQKTHYTNTPDSYTRPARSNDERSPSPPKDAASSRQPKGPPSIELLVADKDNSLNFAARPRGSKLQSIFDAVPTTTKSPRPASRSSQRSISSLGPIEEAFPATTL